MVILWISLKDLDIRSLRLMRKIIPHLMPWTQGEGAKTAGKVNLIA